MKAKLKHFLLSFLIGGVAALTSCATTPRHSFAPDESPAAIEQELSKQHTDLKQKEFDVLSPKHFEAAAKSLEQARSLIETQAENVKVLNALQKAKDEMAMARTHGDLWKTDLHDATSARTKAVAEGAATLYRADLENIDEDLKDITEEDFEAGANRDLDGQLQKRYMGLELKSIQQTQLGEARSMIKSAKERKAKSYAAKTLEKAEADMLTAERAIESNRNNSGLFMPQVARAQTSAKELLHVVEIARESRGKTSEDVALTIRTGEKQLAEEELETERAQRKVDASQEEASALSDEVDEKNQKIESQSNEILVANRGIEAGNQKMQSEKDRAEKLREIGQRFSKEEAEVYFQGGNIVLRLRSIEFPSARSELPSHSLPTLAKVGAVLDDLKAQKVVVEGHTDSVGSKASNQRLSEARATSVSNYLESLQKTKVLSNEAQISSVGRGFDRPLASNKSKQGRAENRRVDIVITANESFQ